MAYQVDFDPGLFMSAATKADQERIAPFKQGMATFSEGLGDFVKRRREKEAQRLFEENLANRAKWKKLKGQLENPEYEEYEEEVRVPVAGDVPETPTVLVKETEEAAGDKSGAPGISLFSKETSDLFNGVPKEPEPKFRIEKVKKTRQKPVELPKEWDEWEAKFGRPLSEQYAEMANQFRFLSPGAAAAMERRAEQERQIEAQLERDAAQSALRVQEQGGMPEIMPLKAQQGELIKQIAHYDKMLSEPMALEFRDQYVAAKRQAEGALAQINAEIMRKLGVEPAEASEEEAETVARVLGRLERGSAVEVCFYSDFHYTVKRGIVDYLDPVWRKLGVSGVTVRFDDIYSVSDRPPVRALDNKFFC